MSFARSALANRFSALVLTAATATLALPLAAAPGVEGSLSAVQGDARVAKALEALRADDGRTFTEQKHIAQIPAPPFKEKVRAEYYLKRFQELGLKDASIAPEGYVIATRKGSGQGPQLVVSAHLDTVFPEGTDLTLKEKDGRTYGPGIGDDARGLAALLSVIDALNKSGIETVGDLVFVGTVGEEELGNLRGVKALFKDRQGIDGFISVDGIDVRRIVNRGTGSHRYEMTFKGPGGHSFAEFGRPSAIHAMGRAIAKIAEVRPPKEPKTTFTVGTVQGGTSVNAIAGEARLTLDMRSNEEAVIIRKYKNIDYVQLCQVHDQARMQELIVGNAVDLYAPLEVAVYKEELFSETIYVAALDSQVVGFVAFRKNELGYIYVLNEFQGRGIGGKLLDTVIPYLERPAFLEVFPTNIKAKRLYRSRGFVEETKEKMILH